MIFGKVKTFYSEESVGDGFGFLPFRTDKVSFGAEFIVGGDFMVVSAVGQDGKGVNIDCDAATNGLCNRSGRRWIRRHV